MKPFFFKIEVAPLPENPQGAGIGGALAHIWIFDTNMTGAKKKALMVVREYGWREITVEIALEMYPEQIADLDTPEAKNYRNAEQKGFSCQFHAWPEIDRPGVYSFERLKMPKEKS